MMAIQEICDRTALATGKTLGELARAHFGQWARACIGMLIVALVVANTLNIAADLVAIGSGIALLHAGPSWLWALRAGAGITALIFLGGFARIQQVFKLLCLSLLSYVAVLFFAAVRWKTVGLDTLVPHVTWSKAYLSLLVAVLGTTISPYLFFWQTANRVEEMRAEDAGGDNPVPLARRTTLGAKGKTRSSRFDVFTGMALSNLVMFAIITATASTLGLHKGTDITSAAQAAGALRPVAGPLASTLFALGFIGSGMLAVPVLAGAGSAGAGRAAGQALGPVAAAAQGAAVLRPARPRDRGRHRADPLPGQPDHPAGAGRDCQRDRRGAVPDRRHDHLPEPAADGREPQREPGRDPGLGHRRADDRSRRRRARLPDRSVILWAG
jgi:Mn2+/Fe2+ NRAMP family transporter